jgi:hypothetical protein
MNARYPARPAGMFGPVNRTHVVAALAAALGVVAGAAGAAAWDVADSDDAYRVYSPPAINIDRVAEQAAVNDAAPIATGVSGADRISAAGRGFVDVDSLEATVSTNAPVSLDGAISGADRISASGNGFVDVDSLDATISANAPVTLGGAISGADKISASGNGFMDVDEVIAEHEAAIEGAGFGNLDGGRGQVFSE